MRRWRELPEARYYRAHVKDIQRTTEQLLELIRNAPEDAIWELSLRASQDMGMPLRQTARTKDGARLPPVGFELSLIAFVSICKTITATGSKRAQSISDGWKALPDAPPSADREQAYEAMHMAISDAWQQPEPRS
jgi:hypothetical protein